MKPAGLDASKGLYSANYLRDSDRPGGPDTKEYQEYAAFMKQYYAGGDPTDVLNLIGYSAAQTLVQTIKQAGNNLTRENLMKQALSLNMTLPMLYPGIGVSTSPSNAYPVEQWQMIQFNGTRYEVTGGILGGGR